MPDSRWSTQKGVNGLNGNFGGSLFYNALSDFLFNPLYSSFAYYIIVSIFVVLWNFCVCKCVSLSMSL